MIILLQLLFSLHFLCTLSQPSSRLTSLTLQNGTEVSLSCPPAEQFARTHMSPDFISPQLIRRLDWFHEDSLIASYQQNVVEDSARQWWVADGRFELSRPFYSLRIRPVRAEDSGDYRCRLETDPLFALTMSTSTVTVRVMVRPVPPSSPDVRGSSNHSVTLSWTHSTASAHRPVLRYSVVVRSLSDGARFVIPAPSNATSVIVDNLSPFTEYAFSVRAENAAGNSDFGPETVYRTQGDVPSPPSNLSISNTSSNCVSLVISRPETIHGQFIGYKITVTKEDGTVIKDIEVTPTPSDTFPICDLHPHTTYTLSVSARSEYGRSVTVEEEFRTDQSVPGTPPTDLSAEGIVGEPALFVHWKPPSTTNGVLTRYNVYYRPHGHNKWKVNTLKIKPQGHTDKYRIEIKGLEAATMYTVRVSASTVKGEGQKSEEVYGTTDNTAPPSVHITNISFNCRESVNLEWTKSKLDGSEYKLRMEDNGGNLIDMNTTRHTMELKGLSLHREYVVRVASLIRSLVDKKVLIEGEWSTPQKFMLDENCSLHSSVCSPSNRKCMTLMQTVSPPRFGLLIIISSAFLFALICAIAIYVLRGFNKCYDVKKLLKKREKSVYLEELSPLVYDSAGCEDIPVELFYGYCEDLGRNECTKYKAQFEQVERLTVENSSDRESLEKNMDKNRYLNIGALESTRIRINSPSGSDYINANYIDSCEKRNAYIATQAPLPSTFIDFYHLLWQERCNILVMITNLVEDGRKKCDQYWPSTTNTPQSHGIYQVSLISQTINAHYIHRILSLRIAKCVPPTERRIHQLHFTGWPDHGVPPTVFPLLSFLNTVSDIHSTGPIVVHCSAGVGRSGSYILIDSMRRHLLSFRSINLMGHLVHMRKQREKLVQTADQYIFCHESVRQLIRHGITRVHAELFQRYIKYLTEENVNGKTRMQMQYEDICHCRHSPLCNIEDEFIVVPGFHRIDEFIVSLCTNESEQLWTIVWEKSVQTIVLLGGDDSFWKGISQVGEMKVEHGEHFVLLQNREEQLCVRIVPVCPSTLHSSTWSEIERIQTERLSYHESPLMVLSPPPAPEPIRGSPIHPLTPRTSRPLSRCSMSASTTVPVNIPIPYPLPSWANNHSMAFLLCSLTALACQLEQQGCVDVVQILASYSHSHCGIWTSRQEIEFLYERMLQLVHLSKV